MNQGFGSNRGLALDKRNFLSLLGALFWRRVSGIAAFWSIVSGGATTVGLTVAGVPLALDPVFYGLGVSAVVLVILTLAVPAPSGVSRGRNTPII